MLTDSKSRIMREIHTVKTPESLEIHVLKKSREFHNNESENISGESIKGAVPTWGRHLITFWSQMQRLFEGGAYSNKYGRFSIGVASCYSSEFARVISALRLWLKTAR